MLFNINSVKHPNLSKILNFIGKHWKGLCITIVTVALLGTLQHCTSGMSLDELRNWKKNVDSQVIPWSKQQDSIAKAHDAVATLAIKKADSLAAELVKSEATTKKLHDRNKFLVDSITNTGLMNNPTKDPVKQAYITTITGLTAEVVSLTNDVTIAKAETQSVRDAAHEDHIGFVREKFRADSLQTVIVKMPPIPTKGESCHVLKYIPCPSRTVMTIVGSIGGAYVGFKGAQLIGIIK
jgi:hypothetical protein